MTTFAKYPVGRVLLHLICLVRFPAHFQWHLRGIGREIAVGARAQMKNAQQTNRRIPFAVAAARKVFATVLALVCCACVLHSAPADVVPGRILVKPRSRMNESDLQRLFGRHGARQHAAIHRLNVRILHVPDARRAAVLYALNHNPDIEFAEPDAIVAPDFIPNDPWYPSEWHLPKIQAPQAWDLTTGSSSVIIAILDTGVDGTHPDLAPNMVPGWNLYDNNADTRDVFGHGTAVAGTAAAVGNDAIGVASVAGNCRLMPIRVSDVNGYAAYSTIANALTYAADHGARVANISYKVTASSAVASAAQYFQSKGGVTSVSAGNDGGFDSAKDNPYVLTVGATTADDILASWSCTGNNTDLAAPGQGIITTTRGGGYGSWAGTSFSAPIVAAAAALVISMNPSLSASQVQEILKQTADDLGPAGWDSSYGWGRVNAYKAVLAAAATVPTDTTAPAATITVPAAGSAMSGTVTIDVGATDNVGVAKVECYINGVLAGTSAAATTTFYWDTTAYADGSYTLQARAYDAAGNVGTSATMSVSVENAALDVTGPVVDVTSPADGATVLRSAKVYVSSSDDTGVSRVDLEVDGKYYSTSSSATPVFSWNTNKLLGGPHTLQAVAYDAAGNFTRSSVVTVYK